MRHMYGHNPHGAMYECARCGWRFRTVERLRRHQDEDQDLCHETVTRRSRDGHEASEQRAQEG